MGSRIPSHQLSNGLYVSGRPEQQLKDRPPKLGSRAVPYTGGDVKKSGELGKMFDIPVLDHYTIPSSIKPPSWPSSSSHHNSGSGPIIRSDPNSGSGQMKKTSLGLQVRPTGLITSGPLSSSIGRRSGQLPDPTGQGKILYGSAVTTLGFDELRMGFRVSKLAMWVVLVVVLMGLVVAAFVTVTVKKPVIMLAVAGVLVPAVLGIVWNVCWKKKGLLGFLRRYPDAELRGALDGQFVKVTGVIS